MPKKQTVAELLKSAGAIQLPMRYVQSSGATTGTPEVWRLNHLIILIYVDTIEVFSEEFLTLTEASNLSQIGGLLNGQQG